MKRQSLYKSLIIRKAEDFNRLFNHGQRYSSLSFLLIILDSNQTKFGVAVSSKTYRAVKRNRARRKTKEILRLNQALLPERKEFIVMAKPGVETMQNDVLSEELLKLLRETQIQ